jgi:hypothetical protein
MMATMSVAQRLAGLLREAAGRVDREAAHALLDAALDLAEAATEAEGQDGRLAQAAALTLSRAVAGWTVPVEQPPEDWDQLAKQDPVQWREDAALCMQIGYAAVPQPVVEALMHCLMTLNSESPATTRWSPNRT